MEKIVNMKILIVTEVFYPENFLINDLATELVKRGYEVEVMTRQPSYPEGYVYKGYSNDKYSTECWNGIKIHRFKIIEGYKNSIVKKILNYYHYVSAGKKIITKIIDNVDLIFIHQTGPLTLALPAIYARKKYHIPTIIWSFDLWPDTVYMYGFPKFPPLTLYLDYIVKKVYQNVDKILVSSRNFIPSIQKYNNNVDIEYAPNWLKEELSTSSSISLPKNVRNFTFTGNISIAQNLENVIKGFFKANIDRAVLNIIGDGSHIEKLKEIVKQYQIRNIIFYGRVPSIEIQDILKQSDFLILPLVSKEGIDKTEPFKIQSYLKAGKPILGVIKGAGKELIEKYNLGICSKPNDIEDIAIGFKRICKLSEKDIEEIKNNSAKLMSERFNRTNIINNIEHWITSTNHKTLIS